MGDPLTTFGAFLLAVLLGIGGTLYHPKPSKVDNWCYYGQLQTYIRCDSTKPADPALKPK